MDVANVGECIGLRRVGIALCMAMAAIGEQGKMKFTKIIFRKYKNCSFKLNKNVWLEFGRMKENICSFEKKETQE